MNVVVIGTGYVGLCSGVGLATVGHQVTCVGRDQKKIENINQGIPPFFEDGLKEALQKLTASGHLKATTDFSVVKDAEAIFICVGTPSGVDGRIDLSQMDIVARQLGLVLKEPGYRVVVVKSTVTPGTTERVMQMLEQASGKQAGEDFGMCMNPEFLREGKALTDFLQPDRVVIGELDTRSGDLITSLYKDFDAPIMRTDLKTAEMIKYVSNSFLATKISFTNEVGNLCKLLGIDVYQVMKGVGLDSRISPKFLEAGLGFGGSCFPKDVSALVSLAEDKGDGAPLLRMVLDVNKKQRFRIVDALKKKMPVLEGKQVALLGLAFKGGTDDIREAPALDIIPALLKTGAKLRAYDPQAAGHVKKQFSEVTYTETVQEALDGADACLVLTDWEEFRGLKDSDFSGMNQKVIIEGRRILDPSQVTGIEGLSW